MPKAKINPVEGVKTTFDVLMQKYDVNDPTVSQIGVSIRDYELMRRLPKNFNLEQGWGVLYVVKCLEKTLHTDAETVSKAFINGPTLRHFENPK